MTRYEHNERLFAAAGANVASGEAIVLAGAPGGADRSGVYFEVRCNGRALDPAPWFARDGVRR